MRRDGQVDASDRLAVLGGFVKPAPSAPHGTLQAQFRMCEAIARTGRFRGIDVFHEDADRQREQVLLPQGVTSRLLERTSLRTSAGAYVAIYVANGEQLRYAPHALRPAGDPAPVVCDIGVAHSPRQWTHFFLSAWNGSLRPTDGFIFKAAFLEGIFREAWSEWSRSTGPLPLPAATVIPNGVDLAANRRNDELRADTRRQLGLQPEDVVFLTFSRLEPVGKGDYRALLFLWRRIVERSAHAILVLSGARRSREFDRGYVLGLRAAARAAGLGNNVIIVEDPYDTWSSARERLMSAADVFVHLSTGAEEVSSNSTLEAMAFGLPVIATEWAGFPELVEQGGTGFLVPTLVAVPPPSLQQMMLGRHPYRDSGDLDRCVGCDGQAFARAAAVLMEQESTRLEMGRRSRLRAEAHFCLETVATRRVAFFDERAGEARGGAHQPGPRRDLIDYRSMLGRMGSRPLSPDDRIAVSPAGGFDFVWAAPDPDVDRSTTTLVERVLRQSAPLTVGQLTARVEAMRAEEGEAADLDTATACARTLLRLSWYGVVQVLGPDPPLPRADPER